MVSAGAVLTFEPVVSPVKNLAGHPCLHVRDNRTRSHLIECVKKREPEEESC